MKPTKLKYIRILLMVLCIFPLSSIAITENIEQIIPVKDSERHQSPKTSDISGNELFAEQIAVNIAGKESLVRQSYITNDTNIFERVDLSDPAFFRSSFYFSISNGISPVLNPELATTNDLKTIELSYLSLTGFLYYDNRSTYDLVQTRKTRALDIFQDLFEVDLLFHDVIEDSLRGYFYPFYGATPNWKNYFETTISNTPQDGYWGAFDDNRLLSQNYLDNQHLSSSLLFLKHYSMLENELEAIAPYNIPINMDLSAIDTSSSLFNFGLDGGGSSQGPSNDNISPNELLPPEEEEIEEEDEEDDNTISYLDELDNVVIYSVQYEGNKEGFSEVGENEYKFDLFTALNYKGENLAISSKCFNSMDGISLSLIDIGFISSEIISTQPSYFDFEDYNLQRIESILFLFDDEFDLSSFKNYSFKIQWSTNESLTRLTTTVQNLANDSDPINFLSLLGGIGSNFGIPGSTIAPLDQFVCIYRPIVNEPSLYIEKKIADGNASNVLFDDEQPSIEIFVENRGLDEIWGQKRDISNLGITNDPTKEITLLDINQNFFELLGYDSDAIIHTTETLGYNLTDLFHNEEPRFFNIDSNNSGTYDITYPQMTNILTNLEMIYPYSPEFAQILEDNPEAFGTVANNPQSFNSSDSIFNPSNWKIMPGDNFTIPISAATENLEDQFESFNSLNISSIEGISPVISYGSIIDNTYISGTYQENDSTTLNLQSQKIGSSYQIQTYFMFQNESSFDINSSNILDGLGIEAYFKNSLNSTTLSLEIYNFNQDTGEEGDEFISIPGIYSVNEPEKINFTISSINYELSEFYRENQNYSIILRVTFENSEKFTVDIDYFQLLFQTRINQEIFHDQAIIQYCSELGTQYLSYSNSFILNTDDRSSLNTLVHMDEYNKKIGEIMTYNISISNVGMTSAKNISLELDLPGKIKEINNIAEVFTNESYYLVATAGNFTLIGDKLFIYFDFLNAGDSYENITFDFIVPNSRILPSATVTWQDEERMENSTIKRVQSNNQYLSAPVRYFSASDTPHKHALSIEYISNFDQNAPEINDVFEVQFRIKNLEPTTFLDIEIPLNSNITGFTLLNETDLIWISSLVPSEDRLITLSYRKDNYRGYTLPQLTINSKIETKFMKQSFSNLLHLGVFNASLSKDLNTVNAVHRDIISITVTLINTGNIDMGNFTIDDTRCYSAEGFTLEDGSMIRNYELLKPGDSITFTYHLRTLNKNGIYQINPAELNYCYIYKMTIESPVMTIMVRQSYFESILIIILPIIVGASVIGFTYYKKSQYSREDLELERRESLLFGQSLRDIAWKKKNLKEFLEELTMEENGS
ncbi:hypothetical protein [Candidatus Lokiarchaeum ossiferum]|uniref:hypothetical protein n=1 Tax=Candidatus Lokiarchaeum ossiferum TaxID=2951803 RepID=UPI00352E4287